MIQHIKELFEAAEPFDEGELYQDEMYNLWSKAVLEIGDKIAERSGEEGEKLVADFIHSYFELENFSNRHYFYQGYLAAKKELAAKKPQTRKQTKKKDQG